MLVQNNHKNTKDIISHVHKEDHEHYYVRNSDGVIQGLLKNKFKRLSKQQSRKIKIQRLLDLKENYHISNNKRTNYTIKNIDVKWSGSYPNLCSGTWTILIDDMKLPIPEFYENQDMGTPGEYETWEFDDNWSEEFSSYFDHGEENKLSWIRYSLECLEEAYSLNFNIDEKLINKIESLISDKDWRSGSCGGCI